MTDLSQQAPVPRPGRAHTAIAALLLGLTLLIYSTGWSGVFLFDDLPAITANPLLQIDGSDFDQWRVAAYSSTAGPLGRPVAMLSFAAHHAVEGAFSAASFKAVNTLVHLLTGLLLFLFTRSLTRGAPALARWRGDADALALLTAGIWLLHPLHVSTVLYAVQRMAQLSTLFSFWGLWVFAAARARWAEHGAGPGDVLACALWLCLLTAAATLSKENGVLLPWLIVVCEVALYRGAWNGRSVPGLRALGWCALAMPLAGLVLLGIVQPQSVFGAYADRHFGLAERLLTETRVLWEYVGLLLWPQPHAMGFQHDNVVVSTSLFAPWTTLVALLGWVAAIVASTVCWRSFPLLGFGVLFFLVAQSMESTVIPLELFYEHRNYLPGYAVLLLAAAGLLEARRRIDGRKGLVVLALPLLLLSVGLAARVHTWSDDLRLAQINATRHPDSARSRYFLGNSLLRQYRRRDELQLTDAEVNMAVGLAQHHFERMYQIDPQELGSLIMLHYVDGLFFRDSDVHRDWFALIMAGLDGSPLSASTVNGLFLLSECLGDGSCEGGQTAQLALEERLRGSYDRPRLVALLRLRYLDAAGAPSAVRQAALQRYLALPDADTVFLAEVARNSLELGDRSGFYAALLRWLQSDDKAHFLQTQKALLHGAR